MQLPSPSGCHEVRIPVVFVWNWPMPLASRNALEALNALGNVMVRLLVASEDRNLGVTESSRVIQSAALQDHETGCMRRASRQVCAAFAAELTRNGVGEVRAPEAF